jgi:phosphoserine phosphatase RsbX
MEAMSRPLLDWGVAGMALAGQAESGDSHVVKELPQGVLVAVVDGLGHGHEAAAAAMEAVATLERHAQEPVVSVVKHCHEALRLTRGVVMSLAMFHRLDQTMTWLGVGNVEGLLVRASPAGAPQRKMLLLRGGVVGDQLPPLSAAILPVKPGDTLILATDGIRTGFAYDLSMNDTPQQLAGRILATHAKGTDDALVLVARYIGRSP